MCPTLGLSSPLSRELSSSEWLTGLFWPTAQPATSTLLSPRQAKKRRPASSSEVHTIPSQLANANRSPDVGQHYVAAHHGAALALGEGETAALRQHPASRARTPSRTACGSRRVGSRTSSRPAPGGPA